jgi:ABC-type lipoprotein release transport system permease subunit
MLNFALESLLRRKYKNLSIFFIFTLLITLLFSIFLTSESIKQMLYKTLKDQPDIFLQRIVAGRIEPVDMNRAYEIAEIDGVSAIYPRVWGYYFFKVAGANFSIIGYEEDMPLFSKAITKYLQKSDIALDGAIVGEGVKKILDKHWFKDSFDFIKSDGSLVRVKLKGSFKGDNLLNYDTILIPMKKAKEIFELKSNEVTDFAIDVANPKEIENIAKTLSYKFPDSRVITKDDLKGSYQNMFDYKSGLFLALLLSSFFAFFILVFEKASSVGKEQAKEIGILKAVGWRIEDVLKLKFLESFLILLSSFMVATLLSYIWVFNLQGVLIKDIFSGFSTLKPPLILEPIFEPSLFITIFLITAPIYLAATIIPAWRAAVVDVEEVLR